MSRVVNTNFNNVYAPFQTNGVNYAISKPITDHQKIETQKDKENKKSHLGRKVALTSLLVGVGAIFLMKGMPKGARLKVDKYFQHLEEKIDKITSQSKKLSFAQDVYLNTLKAMRSLVLQSKALFNLGPLKDVLFLKLRKYSIVDRAFTKITNGFERISVATSRRSYRRTMGRFDDMYAVFSQTNERILREHPEQRARIRKIEELTKSTTEHCRNTCGRAAQDKRLSKTKSRLTGIDKKVYDRTYGQLLRRNWAGLKDDSELYQKFIAEEMADPAKRALAKDLHGSRRRISNRFEDTHIEVNGIVETLANLTSADKESKHLMRNLRNLTGEYSVLPEGTSSVKVAELNRGISQTLDRLKSHISSSKNYDKKIKPSIFEHINDLDSVLKDHKQGEVQDILAIYREILPESEYLKVKRSADKAIKSLNKSVYTESDLLFDKMRDLMIGCAPMDVATMLLTLGGVGLGLSKADDNEERISLGLTHGIPIVGAIATALVCAAGLVSGGQAILGALVAEFLLKKGGKLADNKRKEFMGKEEVKVAQTDKNTTIDKKLLNQFI